MDDLIDLAWHVFFVPGNYILSAVATYAPPIAELLGLSDSDGSGVLAGALSAIVWLAVFVVLGTVYAWLRDVDRAVTAYVARTFADAQRIVRTTRRRISADWHRLRERWRRARRADPESVVAHELDELELKVLQSHAALAPGYMMTAAELAKLLGIRRSESARTLAKLDRLSLVSRSLGARDGEAGYVLTSLGKSFLIAHGPRATGAWVSR